MASIPSATVEHTLEPLPSNVQEIADLARRASERTPSAYEISAARRLVLVKLQNDERIEGLDLEHHLDRPNRVRGKATVYDPSDFVDYVNRLADPDHTTVWADVDTGTVTAVINDHASREDAGWRDHTIVLRLQPDEDWCRWSTLDGKLQRQEDFAEFLEDVAHTVINPDAATMLEVATSMTAKRNIEFSQGSRLQTGDVQLRYEETTQATAGAKGQMEVPDRITVQLAPWRGVVVADLEARLRWRIQDRRLAIGYKLLRPDMFRDEVFSSVTKGIADGLDAVPLYQGATPGSLRP